MDGSHVDDVNDHRRGGGLCCVRIVMRCVVVLAGAVRYMRRSRARR